jgi:hypothetical protein
MKEVYAWVDKYGGSINGQLRRLGSSFDWERSVRLPALQNIFAAIRLHLVRKSNCIFCVYFSLRIGCHSFSASNH